MRYTRQFLETMAKRTLTDAGYRWNDKPWNIEQDVAGRKADVGSVHLAKGPAGWDIHQITNEAGGIKQVNGWCNSFTAAELVAFLGGLEVAARNLRCNTTFVGD